MARPRDKALRLQISQFRHETRMYSLAASVILGILISLAGVRALAAVLEVEPIEQWYWHNGFFSVLDVLITGALLGGGADAIHKIVSTFTTLMEATKSRVKAVS
jgi:hypothetical protein